MPHTYERDDRRRLITVKVSDPPSVDDILSAIDRQAAEDTWAYAMLYDLRSVTQLLSEAEVRMVADHVKAIGVGRPRGPVGIAIDARPEWLRLGITYSELIRTVVVVEILLTTAQLDDWLLRHSRRRSRDE